MATTSGAGLATASSSAAQPTPARPRPVWLPVWSGAAALRALRATLVVPGCFAICYEVIGNLQMATFAAFGGFGTLLFAAFNGSRRDKLIAHTALAVVGSVLLTIGTAVSFSTAVAALVTVPLAFAVLFAGVAGPNAAVGGTAALLAYVLPAASAGGIDTVPDRLAGWWLASVVGTAAVLLLSARPPADRLRAAAADSAEALAHQLAAALDGNCLDQDRDATIAAKHRLMDTFIATPYRPTGLATRDRALANLVWLLEWCTAVVCDSLRAYTDLRDAPEVERNLLAVTTDVLSDIASLLRGQVVAPDLRALEQCLADSVAHLTELHPDNGYRDDDGYRDAVHLSYHARTVAMAVRTAAADTLIVGRQADPAVVAERRRQWIGAPNVGAETDSRFAGLVGAGQITRRHASVRSVWFRNSMRGAIALAAAVAVADLSNVQHGFWVVLGTLSVLRTNAIATGATALRALLGTAAGFVIGAVLILAIGTSSGALWIALPIAVAIAAYTPGVAPFAVGQAAFTVVISVLFNLLAPAGWKIGVLRIEDVALGCAVSLLVGIVFWPRGATSIVGDDLADAFRSGSAYLVRAVDWALGERHEPVDAVPAVAAAVRLDDALRGFLAEQGTKRVPKQDLWRLVSGTMRLRLTAFSLAGLPNPSVDADPARTDLVARAKALQDWYGQLAAQVGHADQQAPHELTPPQLAGPVEGDGVPAEHLSCTLWVGEHLRHLSDHLDELTYPAVEIAGRRSEPWWR